MKTLHPIHVEDAIDQQWNDIHGPRTKTNLKKTRFKIKCIPFVNIVSVHLVNKIDLDVWVVLD